MIIYDCKENCSGCNACFNICPKDAIAMVEDEKGFMYPKIDNSKCVECNLCIKVCPLKKELSEIKQIGVYALKNKDEMIRSTSSSGGFFYELSKYIINNGGYVFGAIYDDNFDVCHFGTNNLKECEKFKGSKYVKSDTNITYKEVQNLLAKNQIVLYSGTPCQIDGLRSYLSLKRISQENLITCENVCHGTPSPKIFREYKNELEEKFNSNIKDFTFRYKTTDSTSATQNICVRFENEESYIESSFKDKYYKLFLQNINLRDCCFSCQYSNTNRVGDFSMADFWGIEKSIKDFDDEKGVSLVLVNTLKAQKIFDIISEKFTIKESNVKDALQTNLIHPSIPHKNKDKFWSCYVKKGYSHAVNKYTKISIKQKIKSLIKFILIKLNLYEKIIKKGG